jgi:hypothetical protein
MNDLDLLQTRKTAVEAAIEKERRMVHELLKHLAPGTSRRKEQKGEILTFDWVNVTWPRLPIKLCAGPTYEGNLFTLVSDLNKHRLGKVLDEQMRTYSTECVGVVFDVRGDGLPYLVLQNYKPNENSWVLQLPSIAGLTGCRLWVQTLVATVPLLHGYLDN